MMEDLAQEIQKSLAQNAPEVQNLKKAIATEEVELESLRNRVRQDRIDIHRLRANFLSFLATHPATWGETVTRTGGEDGGEDDDPKEV